MSKHPILNMWRTLSTEDKFIASIIIFAFAYMMFQVVRFAL